jgi:hypothetical protein
MTTLAQRRRAVVLAVVATVHPSSVARSKLLSAENASKRRWMRRRVERAQAVVREALDAEARHHRPEDHRGAQAAPARLDARARQVAHEPAREAVARAGRIDDLLERQRRRREDLAVRVEQQRPVLAALDDEVARTHRLDPRAPP